MNILLDTLKTLSELGPKGKRWAVATTLLFISIYFLSDFYLTLSANWTKYDKYSVEIDRIEHDNENAGLVFDKSIESLGIVMQAYQTYERLRVQIVDEGNFSLEDIAQANREMATALRNLSYSIGIIEGINFDNPQLNFYVDGITADLQTFRNFVEMFYQLWKSAENSDIETYTRVAEQIEQYEQEVFRASGRFSQRATNFSNDLMGSLNESILDTKQKTSDLRQFRIKTWCVIPLVWLYVGGYVFFAFRHWKRNKGDSRSNRQTTSPQKNTPRARKPKKRSSKKKHTR